MDIKAVRLHPEERTIEAVCCDGTAYFLRPKKPIYYDMVDIVANWHTEREHDPIPADKIVEILSEESKNRRFLSTPAKRQYGQVPDAGTLYKYWTARFRIGCWEVTTTDCDTLAPDLATQVRKTIFCHAGGSNERTLCRLGPSPGVKILVEGRRSVRSPDKNIGFSGPHELLDKSKRLPGPQDASRTVEAFLDKLKDQGVDIGFPQYIHIDDVYVKPREYNQIERILKEKHIVFIIGPPHIGKTFSAVHFLWRYYKNYGREPRWIVPKTGPGHEPLPDTPRRTGEELDDPAGVVTSAIGPSYVTYVEDIFGRTCNKEAQMGLDDPHALLVNIVKRAQKGNPDVDARVILTSREELFDKASRRNKNLESLVVRLRKRAIRMVMTSYGRAKRLDLMRKYSRLYECEWADKLPADVLKAVDALDTPHAMRWYCELAKSATTAKKRCVCLQEARQELIRGFANEIVALDEKAMAALFTAALFWWEREHVTLREIFVAAVSNMAWPDPEAAWMQAMRALERRVRLAPTVTFEHPAYESAVGLAIRAKGPGLLFRTMAQALSQHHKAVMRCIAAWAIGTQFGYKGAEYRVILAKLARDPSKEVRAVVGLVLASVFDRLDAEGRELVAGLAKDRAVRVRSLVASGLSFAVRRLDATGKEYLVRLAKSASAEVTAAVAYSLGDCFEELDAEGVELLTKVLRNPSKCICVVFAALFCSRFKERNIKSRALVAMLAHDPLGKVRAMVAWGLARSFEELDAEGRALLATLAKDPIRRVRSMATYVDASIIEKSSPGSLASDCRRTAHD